MPAPPKYSKSAKLYHRVEPELCASLKELSEKLEINSSELIRRILWNYVDTFNSKGVSNRI